MLHRGSEPGAPQDPLRLALAPRASSGWQPPRQCVSPQEAWLLNREQELREEIRKGRDKEIELVIHRLEADMALAKEESEKAAESR